MMAEGSSGSFETFPVPIPLPSPLFLSYFFFLSPKLTATIRFRESLMKRFVVRLRLAPENFLMYICQKWSWDWSLYTLSLFESVRSNPSSVRDDRLDWV